MFHLVPFNVIFPLSSIVFHIVAAAQVDDVGGRRWRRRRQGSWAWGRSWRAPAGRSGGGVAATPAPPLHDLPVPELGVARGAAIGVARAAGSPRTAPSRRRRPRGRGGRSGADIGPAAAWAAPVCLGVALRASDAAARCPIWRCAALEARMSRHVGGDRALRAVVRLQERAGVAKTSNGARPRARRALTPVPSRFSGFRRGWEGTLEADRQGQ